MTSLAETDLADLAEGVTLPHRSGRRGHVTSQIWPKGSRCPQNSQQQGRPVMSNPISALSIPHTFIPHKVLFKSFCKSQFSHILVDLLFILVIVDDKLTDV